MCAREPTQGFLTQGLRVRPVATPRRGGFRVGAIGQIGIARGGGEGKKLTFCYFWYCPDLPGRFLSNSVRNRGDPDDEVLGFGGPLDLCCWKRRQPDVVASLEDFSLWSKASVFSKATVDLQKERLQDSTSPPRYMYSK